jgi:hypothetical protein
MALRLGDFSCARCRKSEAYYRNKTEAEIQAVDNNFMRESDPRMPLFKDKKTQVTFGKGLTK